MDLVQAVAAYPPAIVMFELLDSLSVIFRS
ncbi:hypothetical protein AHiyo8_20970 [Arthrobacter sp. Hiyo8]|nr:hypothetical protein AHiyo8_20970 [Arthrobacter sp. Hiyo8]